MTGTPADTADTAATESCAVLHEVALREHDRRCAPLSNASTSSTLEAALVRRRAQCVHEADRLDVGRDRVRFARSPAKDARRVNALRARARSRQRSPASSTDRPSRRPPRRRRCCGRASTRSVTRGSVLQPSGRGARREQHARAAPLRAHSSSSARFQPETDVTSHEAARWRIVSPRSRSRER
jgi:hypothetical protein